MSEDVQAKDPGSSWPRTGDWFVLHARPRQEKALSGDLQSRGLGVFLPLIEQVQFYGRRKVISALPMFPGYVFLRGEREDAFTADRTRRVVNIIEVADQATLDWELSNIHLAVSRDAPLDVFPYLKVGVRVEVRSGPFRGLQGVVEERVAPDRLLLQVDMLGRAMSLELEGALLDVIERA